VKLSSDILDYEISQTPDAKRRARVNQLARYAQRYVAVDDNITERAMKLETLGLDAYDALHIASAEAGQADVFLTTDRALLRRTARMADALHIRVVNPLTWLREVLHK